MPLYVKSSEQAIVMYHSTGGRHYDGQYPRTDTRQCCLPSCSNFTVEADVAQ